MDKEAVTAKLDQVALDLSLQDFNDLQSFMSVQEALAQIAACCTDTAQDVAQGLADLCMQTILEEVTDRESALGEIGAGVELLQQLLEGDCLPAETAAWSARVQVLMGTDTEAEAGTEQGTNTAEESDGTGDEDAPPESAAVEERTTQTEAATATSATAAAVPAIEHDDLFFAFVTEAKEHLEAAESALLELQTNPVNDDILNELFRSFHTIKGAAGFLNLINVSQVTHAAESLLDLARKGRLRIEADRMDAVFATIDKVRNLIVFEESGAGGDPPACAELIGQLQALADPDAQVEVADAPSPDVRGPATSPAAPGSSGGETGHKSSFVRVDTEKLDDLVNMMGELVIAYSLVTSRAEALSTTDPQLLRETTQMAKIIKDLQERAMALRMVPIKGVFDRMSRLIYDLSRKTDKKVDLQRLGEETEVDKNVVEEIVDPLVHLVRNSVDHGIEAPAERVDAGKPEVGTVVLSARHQGGNIVIELRDDGKGLSREKIHDKAVERGVITGDEELTDSQVYELIFQPGFSTAAVVTDISGRGVGLDVVRQNVSKLRGKVEISSTPGGGSVFTISLPLTLAIIDGMVISAGGERYILPLLSIVESLRPLRESIHTIEGRGEMVKIRDSLYPIVRLQDLFDVQAHKSEPWEALLVMLEGESGRYCLMVDDLVGIQQVVIKGLEESMRGKGVSGCAILGDGRVGLILDVEKVFQLMVTSPGGAPATRVSSQTEKMAPAVAA